MPIRLYTMLVSALALGLVSCRDAPPASRFEKLPAEATGVDFVNAIPENDTVNILYYEYLYNGGGVGVGDFDRDGKPDLFFAGNLTSSRLYLQRETWSFTDVTEAAGVSTDYWCAGVNVADVDGNGWEDIYLVTLDPDGSYGVPNRLFLNQGTDDDGVPQFREAAVEVGLADESYGTHSVWIDYDADGDLDLYVINNSIEPFNRNTPQGSEPDERGRSVDRLYRNVTVPGADLPRFEPAEDVGLRAGWGLGGVVQDFDGDARPELYVTNDFISDDFLLRADSTGLRDVSRAALAHTSKNSMGVDAADLNNDGFPEIMVVDMHPDDNRRRKTMFADIAFAYDRSARDRGHGDQYVRNTLQLNNRDGTFSDIAYLSGVAATDWSWAPLLADFDNDGWRDIFVSNGYPKDVTDRDFVEFSQMASQFGTEEAQLRAIKEELRHVGGVHQANFLFRNRGDLTFDVTDWLPADPSYANGAVTVDVDGDGDLDIVTNNINEPAGIYRNNLRESGGDSTHYLVVRLRGPSGNPDGLGAKVYVEARSLRAYAEQQRQRGYLSTVDAALHFGLGGATRVERITVVWPDGRVSRREELPADTTTHFDYRESTAPASPPNVASPFAGPGMVLDTVSLPGLPVHAESDYRDFDHYALALRDFSHDGPALAVDDGNRLIFGGAAGEPVRVLDPATGAEIQRLAGTIAPEATRLLLLDYDGDGDRDLYVGHGSSEFATRPDRLPDLLYRNDEGRYVPDTAALPGLKVMTGAVVAADVDRDGDPDVFVGARQLPGRYPFGPASYLLRNDGGRFGIRDSLDGGMITDAVFADLNGDGWPDLATVGEYAPPRIWLNREGRLEPQPELTDLSGWYYSLTPNDLDGDGDVDLLAGNLGRNAAYPASPERPLAVRAEDYDGNGAIDPIVTAFLGDTAYPVHPRNTLGRQLPGLKRRMPDYATYGGWTEADLPPLSEAGLRLEVRDFRSVWLENRGDGTFVPHFLPATGQTAPIRAAVETVLPDGRAGLLVVQNDHATEVLGGRLDAGTGFALTLDGAGEPEVLPRFWSVRGDARSVVRWQDYFLVGRNGGRVAAYGARAFDAL